MLRLDGPSRDPDWQGAVDLRVLDCCFLSATLVRSVVRRQPSVVWSIEGLSEYFARIYDYNAPFVQ